MTSQHLDAKKRKEKKKVTNKGESGQYELSNDKFKYAHAHILTQKYTQWT